MKIRLFDVQKNVEFTQARNCLFCLHFGTTAIYLGIGLRKLGKKIELFTPIHKFRYSS